MNSKTKTKWEDILQFEDHKEKMEHHADMLSLKIALEIKRYLEDNEISNKEMAGMMGTSAAYITQVLRGDKRINMLFLAKVNSALGLELSINIAASHETDKIEFEKAFDYPHSGKMLDVREPWILHQTLAAVGGFKK